MSRPHYSECSKCTNRSMECHYSISLSTMHCWNELFLNQGFLQLW